MNVSEQGIDEQRAAVSGGSRYVVTPRTLVFLLGRNPATDEEEILLLRGAPDKRLWANRYNGLGGHVRADEDLFEAARREVKEESGIDVRNMSLRGVVNIAIDGGRGVHLHVFVGRSVQRTAIPSAEGGLEWVPLAKLDTLPLVDDLPHLLSRLLTSEDFVYGHYTPAADGRMHYRFRSGGWSGLPPAPIEPKFRTGVDVVEICRIRRAVDRWGERFLRRVFTPTELESCAGRLESLAARFAAKEALAKVLGTGVWRHGVVWTDFEIERDPEGEPQVTLRGGALIWAREWSIRISSLSLSHDGERAIAYVVATTQTGEA